MEGKVITATLLFVHFGLLTAAVMSQHCSTTLPSGSKCTALNVTDATVCYKHGQGNEVNASVICNNGGSTTYNFTCVRTGSSGDWVPIPNVSCGSQVPSTSSSKTTAVKQSTTTRISSSSSSTTHHAATFSSDSTEKSNSSTTARTHSSTGTTKTASTTFTSVQTTEITSTLGSTTLSLRKSQATSDDSGSVVVPVVSVFVVVVIALAAVIVFLLWRHRRMKHQKAKVDYAGTSISNRGYEDDHGLDRHISLLDMRYDDSNDSGYAEISPGKLNVEEGPDNEYQTIKDLPEDKMDGNSGYGHLKMPTTTFIDNNYSHVAVNQNGKQSSDVTYSHTGNPLNAQELKDDQETTYNHLEKNARKTQGTQQPLKNEEKELVGDVDAEYNLAKAGHLALEPDNKGDTYSHLNNTRNSRRIQQDDLKFLTHGSKTETYRTKTGNFDSDKGDGKNTFPEYAKCAKKVNDRETPKQVGHDGYETPAGAANIYFTLEPESKLADRLEPESKLADRDVSFQVTNETFEDSEGEESPNHQYFILEKTDTNT